MGDFEARIASLTAPQRTLLARRLDSAGARATLEQRRDPPTQRPRVLVAHVVSAKSQVPSSDELRQYLRERLPDYMVPSFFVFSDELPVHSSGKVDKQKLPETDLSVVTSALIARPRTPAEETLSQIWAEVLGVEEVDLEDDFFELGGDSLLSMRIIARARQAGLDFTPKQFFDAPTVAGIAAFLTPDDSKS